MTGIACAFGRGGSGKLIQLPGGSVSHGVVGAGPATAGFRFNTNGTADQLVGAVYSGVVPWYVYAAVAGIGNGYWIKAVLLAGAVPSVGTLGTWLALSTARQWTNTMAVQGNRYSELLVSVASSASDADIVDQGSYQIEAELAF